MEETQWLICHLGQQSSYTGSDFVTKHVRNIPGDTEVLHINSQEVLLKLQVLLLLAGQ